jgi:D-beta-D-heptose 7-phosphate kinase/D-beta-D-heptose 1-phosphate adenosyltransferase
MKTAIEYGKEIVKMKVWTNGCFDVLHRGHIELFRYARSLGDELIVGIDTDEKVKKDKGKNRPINNLHDRILMLQSIKYIDKVIPFDSTTELERTLKWIHPSVMVIGADWKGKDVIGKKHADKLIFFDRVGDYSTTKILEKK